MSKKSLTRLGLDPELVRKLNNAGLLTAEDIIDSSEPQLMFSGDLCLKRTRELVAHVAGRTAPKIRRANEMLLNRLSGGARAFLPLQLPSVDLALGGGLSRGTLSEVVGPAGAGKTQLCLSVAAMAGVPESLGGLGEGTGVLYLDTERKFSAARLVEIARARSPEWYGHSNNSNSHSNRHSSNSRHSSSSYSSNGNHSSVIGDGSSAQSEHHQSNSNNIYKNDNDENTSFGRAGDASSLSYDHDDDDAVVSQARIEDLLRRVNVIPVDESHDLMTRLEDLESLLIEHRVGVLVLDSIAALARNDFHHQDDNSSSIASIGQHHINPNSRAAASSSSSSNTNHLGASSYSSSSSSRANALTAQAAALKRLADTFNLVVLITNQVTANMSDSYDSTHPHSSSSVSSLAPAQLTVIGGSSNNWALEKNDNEGEGGRGGDGGSNMRSQQQHMADGGEGGISINLSSSDARLGANVVPALGNSWHHCVSTRLVLEQLNSHQRALTITKSPIAAQITCRFVVAAPGLVEVVDSKEEEDDKGGRGDVASAGASFALH